MILMKNLFFTMLVLMESFLCYVVYLMLVPRMLHIFQMEGYKTEDYIRWLSKNAKNAFAPGLKMLLKVGIPTLIYIILNAIISKNQLLSIEQIWYVASVEYLACLAIFVTACVLQILKDRKQLNNAKKKLVYTKRAKRLIFFNFVVFAILIVSIVPEEVLNGIGIFQIFASFYIGIGKLINDYGVAEFSEFMKSLLNGMLKYVYYAMIIATIPVNMILANFVAWPGEQRRQEKFIKKARRKLNKKDYSNLIRIGITGSYGKTSTKFILKTLLSEKYNVLATPESYNTTNGNLMVINNNLMPEHEVLISEMGARYKGDIKEICNFVRPHYTMITSIGPQHLETFKSIDNIVKTKSEIISGMEDDGTVFLPLDNEYCNKIYKSESHKKCSYSLKNKKADVYAKDIVLDENGSNFTAITKIGNIKCKTKLLGEHNIGNILGCIAMAIELGLSAEQIEEGVKKIQPVEHRLQMLNNNNGTIVIDDAFNSNPVGAKMAIDVLGKFKGRKIVITPGMVELGKEEKKENKNFGRHMASVVDIAILVGLKRSEPIVEGLKEGKFDQMNIFVVEDLKAATAKLAEISKVGDVILFENDLPDSYNEN